MTVLPEQEDAAYRPGSVATDLERILGGPDALDGLWPPTLGARYDDAEDFPDPVCAALEAAEVPRWFVPARHGGALRRAEDLWHILRTLSRRDFTVALGHAKTYLGSVSVWVAGTDEQAAWLARQVQAGAVVSLALTELEHGSDLLAGEVTATPCAEGYRIDGTKWLINNANRADLVCVLARTATGGGARGFSMLLVDKATAAPGTVHGLPRVPTNGVRGADISGVRFDGAVVGTAARVGAEGAGLEVILKGFQITRTLCSAMSVGMGQHALELAVRFATGHRLYGRDLVELPHTARTLAESCADLLLAEAVGLLGTRGLHTLGGEQSVVSAVVKYLVPTVVDRMIADLGQVLGARALLVDDHADGAFQKVERDHRIVGIFDGSTAVNLQALINQFSVLARGYRAGTTDQDAVAAAADLSHRLDELDPAVLSLYSRRGCSVVAGLPSLAEQVTAGTGGPLGAAVTRLRELADALHDELAAYRPVAIDVPVHAFSMARRYALVYAGTAALTLWWHNRDSGPGLVGDPVWLLAALQRVLGDLDPQPDYEDAEGPGYDALLPWLTDRVVAVRPLSLLDLLEDTP